MKKILKNRKGSVEAAAVLIILPLLITIAFNPLLMQLDILKYQRLDMIAKTYISKMEVTGGLTATDYNKLLDDLKKAGFDITKTKIDYSAYPVAFGEQVYLRITVDTPSPRVSMLPGGFESGSIQMVAGPYYSISKKK